MNEKFVKAGEGQHYWEFPEPRFDLVTRTMVPCFEILLDSNNRVPELKKEDTTWVPTNWADHMDLYAMTTLLGDPICNIEEEEYWEACQHTLKNLYELIASDGDEEGGTTPSDDEDESEDKSDSSNDNNNSNGGHGDDDSNTNNDDNNNKSYDSSYSRDVGVNPLVKEKMKMQTYFIRIMTVMWTIPKKT